MCRTYDVSKRKPMHKAVITPEFKSESQEADWWASPVGRYYIEQKSAVEKSTESSLVAMRKKQSS